MSRLHPGAAAFFCLLAATLAAAVLVVRARTPDLVLEETGGLPTSFVAPPRVGDGGIRLTFFVREADPAAVVGVVDRNEELVRTLADGVALEPEEEVTYVWDGRTDDGRVARPGRYRLAVELPGSDRMMVWPQRLTLETAPAAVDEGEPG